MRIEAASVLTWQDDAYKLRAMNSIGMKTMTDTMTSGKPTVSGSFVPTQ